MGQPLDLSEPLGQQLCKKDATFFPNLCGGIKTAKNLMGIMEDMYLANTNSILSKCRGFNFLGYRKGGPGDDCLGQRRAGARIQYRVGWSIQGQM